MLFPIGGPLELSLYP